VRVSAEIDRLGSFEPFDPPAGGSPAHGAPETKRYVVMDVFTDTPLEGNALAVFTDGRELSSETMQRLARELNLSETVFVLPSQAEGDVRVRIFTPSSELPFAGHPVLGTGVLVGLGLKRDRLVLETGAGPVQLALGPGQGSAGFGRMRQPIPYWGPYERERELLAALGVERSGLPVEVYCNGPLHVYVELEDERAVAALQPDLLTLAELGEIEVSCFAGSGRRWKTRMFAPGIGVAEDPATGAAAGPLAAHLARHGRVAFGEEIEIRQGAEVGRPSLLLARVQGTPERLERVEVGGSAVVVAAGTFVIPGLAGAR
jgi:trans-2,3-dihydro-3-hydroxyanthranilate isomerase